MLGIVWFRLKTSQANFREQVMISSWAFVLGPYNSPPPPTIPFSDRRDGIVVTLTARGELCLKLLLLDTKHQAINALDLTAYALSTRKASCQDQWPRLPDLFKESILLFLLIFSASLVFLLTLRYT